jgi:phospholipid/cholesterol/gamma-HCH transport system substrate-binding protein
MKDSRRYETIVGIFVVASLAVLLVMVLIIARQEGLFQHYVKYKAVFKNVGGLKSGDEVHLSGVTVGNVKDITISPDGATEVIFNVIQRYSDRVRQDSQASIGYMGLLGERDLDVKAGTPGKPAIPPEAVVPSVEPLEITQLLAKAGPSLEDLQKILHNLATLTGGMGKQGGNLTQILEQVKEIVTKINHGKGTLGMLVNDSNLYKETTETVGGAKKIVTGVEQSFFGKGSAEKRNQAIAEFQGTLSSAHQTARNLQEATTGLPQMLKKADTFLDHLKKAGRSLPELINQTETTMSDVDNTAKAAQRSWLLRWSIRKPHEHTILMDDGQKKD